MKILIDARFYGLENAGIGRYVINLLENLEKIDKENDYFILLRRKYFQDLRFKSKRFRKILADYSHYSLKEQIILPLQLIKLKPDLVHFPHFNVPIFWWGKQIVTIHDLIKHTSRGMETTTRTPWLYWFKYLGYKITFSQAVNRASKILVPSKTIKDELTRIYSLPEEKIVVTYEGVGKEFKSQKSKVKSQNVLEKYKIKKPFIIYTGSLYPHKNVERLIQAIKLANQASIALVVCCSRSVFWERLRKKIKEQKAEEFVTLAGFVLDGELVSLYQEAEAFVFPTLAEGFGLPGLEAMAAGCPVVCSDIPVLREVYDEAADYFNPLDSKDIAQKIKLVIGDDKRKQKLKKLGLELVEKYSWQKMAKQTLGVYQEAMKI